MILYSLTPFFVLIFIPRATANPYKVGEVKCVKQNNFKYELIQFHSDSMRKTVLICYCFVSNRECAHFVDTRRKGEDIRGTFSTKWWVLWNVLLSSAQVSFCLVSNFWTGRSGIISFRFVIVTIVVNLGSQLIIQILTHKIKINSVIRVSL